MDNRVEPAGLLGLGGCPRVPPDARTPTEVTAAALRHGRQVLEDKLGALGAPALVFPFKQAAVAPVGRFEGNGRLDRTFAGCRLFVMPGPHERRDSADMTIATLAAALA